MVVELVTEIYSVNDMNAVVFTTNEKIIYLYISFIRDTTATLQFLLKNKKKRKINL